MKTLTLLSSLLMTSLLNAQSLNLDAASGPIGTLNQVTPETDQEGYKIKSPEEQQDVQERIYWENKEREEQEWEDQKKLDDHRFDVPGT